MRQYSATHGPAEKCVLSSARFEAFRSCLIETAYDLSKDHGKKGTWLGYGIIKEEIEQCMRAASQHLENNGLEKSLRQYSWSGIDLALNERRLALEKDTMDYKRFMGSVRVHIPGIGYAISIRKRVKHNEDSFLMAQSPDCKVLAVCDGLGAGAISALASHLMVKRLGERLAYAVKDMRSFFISTSGLMSVLLNNPIITMLQQSRGYGMTTATTLVSSGEAEKVTYIGDSIAFRIVQNGTRPHVEQIGGNEKLKTVIGSHSFADSDIHEEMRKGGRYVITSDGITNLLDAPVDDIRKVFSETSDSVKAGEAIVRKVLANQIVTGKDDDATIIVQDG